MRSSGSSTVTAAIPDPGFFDRPRIVGAEASDLERTELGMHAQIGWLVPVTDKIDILLSAGPSFIRLTQELTPTVTVPARTQTISVVRERQSGTALGFNAVFDGTLLFTPRYGVGLFGRYARPCRCQRSGDERAAADANGDRLDLEIRRDACTPVSF